MGAAGEWPESPLLIFRQACLVMSFPHGDASERQQVFEISFPFIR